MSDDNATATKKLSFQATVKKEMNLFQSTNERSKNLNLLYMILQNISPTSVAMILWPKRGPILNSDKTIDNLCFLKGSLYSKIQLCLN